MSCFLAALGMVRCLNKAQKAIDDFNDVHRFGGEGATEEEKVMAWNLAERMGAVTSYLDDASFVAVAAALCVAYGAYTTEAAKRGWKCVESKSVLALGFYKTTDGETPKPHRGTERGKSDCVCCMNLETSSHQTSSLRLLALVILSSYDELQLMDWQLMALR